MSDWVQGLPTPESVTSLRRKDEDEALAASLFGKTPDNPAVEPKATTWRMGLPPVHPGPTLDDQVTDSDKVRGTAVTPVDPLPSNEAYRSSSDPKKNARLQAAFDGGASVSELVDLASGLGLQFEHGSLNQLRGAVRYRNSGRRGARIVPEDNKIPIPVDPNYRGPNPAKVVADHNTSSLSDMLYNVNKLVDNPDPDVNVQTAEATPVIGDAMSIDSGVRHLIHGSPAGAGEAVLGGLVFVPGEKFLAAGSHILDAVTLKSLTRSNVDAAQQLVRSTAEDALSRGGSAVLHTADGQTIDLSRGLPDNIDALTADIRSGKARVELHVPEGTELHPAAPETEAAPLNPDELPEDHPVRKIINALDTAKTARRETDTLRSAERSRRVGAASGVAEKTSGLSGFHAELGQLKGEMPTAEFEGIGQHLNEQDITDLADMVKHHPTFNFYDKINARHGLEKLLGVAEGVPTKTEIRLLSQVFPKELIDGLSADKMAGGKFGNALTNAINFPRALMASMDLSAPFRQGIFLIGSKSFWTSQKDMIRSFGSKAVYEDLMNEITSRPTYELMEKSGLAITNTGKNLYDREEAFLSKWAEEMPGDNALSEGYNATVGRGVRASDRAYTGYLNKLRADTFDGLVRDMTRAGVDLTTDKKALRDIARFVNAATGRGSLGSLNRMAPQLANIFFSPRLIASRIQLLNPVFYIKLHPVVRRQALKSLLSFSATATTVLGLADAGGASVEWDPRSSDFGKIKIGNTRYDILGGFSQYLRAGAQVVTGQRKKADGEIETLGGKYGSDTRLDVLEKFFENKLAPVPSLIADLLRGKDAVGNDISVPTSVAQRFVPLVAQDMYSLYKDGGLGEMAEGTVPALFGVGVQTYAPRDKKDGMMPELSPLPKDTAPEVGAEDKWVAGLPEGVDPSKAADSAPAADSGGWVSGPPTEASIAHLNPLISSFEAGHFESGRRTIRGNRAVGGVSDSAHLRGDGADFTPAQGQSLARLAEQAREHFGPHATILIEARKHHVHVTMPGLNAPYFGRNGVQ